jgi:hypothetical protein
MILRMAAQRGFFQKPLIGAAMTSNTLADV